MIFDTDIFIWAQRGNNKAAGIIDTTDNRYLSVQSYMELLQGARNKTQHQYIKNFLSDLSFTSLPLTVREISTLIDTRAATAILYTHYERIGEENVDMCLRLQQASWQVVYNPDSILIDPPGSKSMT